VISSARTRTTAARILAVVLAALVAVAASLALAAPASASIESDEARLFELQNQARSQNGLAPLAYDSAAVGVARAWAQELARSGNLRHNPNLVAEVDAHVTTQWTRVGENVGYSRDADQVFNAYMNSTGHRANILGAYNRVGVGAARGSDGRLWTTVVFLQGPALAAPPPAPTYPFTDIAGSVHVNNIVFATNVGLLKGGPAGLPSSEFGPTLLMTRGQLATLVRNVLASAGINPSSAPNAFTDDAGSVHEGSINALAALGVIGGNGESGSSFFPSANATRSHIASFLGRAYELVTRTSLPTSPDAFTDDERDPAEAEINGLAALGVVSGKSPGIFDPGASVTRAQVATMVVKLLEALS
jgi:uncharacterized protein YkwD